MTDFGERRRTLPKTYQIISFYDGDDGYYQKGWDEGERFKDVGDGTIVDNATGLMWPDDLNGPGGNEGVGLAWEAAIDYAEALSFAGHRDWRLCNAVELLSLFDYSKEPIEANTIIQNAQGEYLWTSNTTANNADNAYFWYYTLDRLQDVSKAAGIPFLCVRDA